VPHYLGPGLSFIEVQEPSDHIVIPETDGDDDAAATMGLGWELALDMIDYTGTDAAATLRRARQQPRVLRTSHSSREIRLLHDDVLPYFDATALEVEDDIEVSDGRFSIAVVVSGSGSAEGDFGRQPLRRGETYALPGSLALRVRAGPDGPVRVIRCLGPTV
jgi:mannose-6-phosphate isomerase